MSSGTRTKAIRRGKLHGRYQELSNHWNRGRDVPWLNVRGLWLEEAGFNVGDPIEIIVSKEKLVIKKAHDGNSGH